MSTIFERLPVARIETRARSIDARRALLGVLTLPFLAVGFAAAATWTATIWICASVMEGWVAGRTATTRSTPVRRGS